MTVAGWAALAWLAVAIPAAYVLGPRLRRTQERYPMPAITWDLYVEAGSYEPQYLVLRDPESGDLLDLTSGYSVRTVIATRPDGLGTVLADLDDADGVWRRTAEGRLYFEPPSAVTSAWTFRHGYHQVELSHPSGEQARIAAGRIRVSPELVTD